MPVEHPDRAAAHVQTRRGARGSGGQHAARQRFGAGLLAPTPGLLQLLERHGRADLLAGIGSVRVEERVLAADAAGLVYGFVDHETESAAASYREAPQRVVVHQPLRITDDMTLA